MPTPDDVVDAAAPKLSTLGKYSLIASLGQGGMAKVYLALMAGPAGFNKLLVIKALREDMLSSSEEFVHMFLDEARLAARLNHPNIVQTYEVGEAEGRYFIAMEYLEGQSLRTVQRRLSPNGLPLEEELRVISETARGLHYAHELKGFDNDALGVVHRDVSPQNVFLTYDGQVKLLDFGIAKTQDAEHLTKVGVIKGKIDYIAPEQVRGDKVDRRADVFALGAMLWEAITGRRFAGGPKVADVTKIHTRVTGAEPKVRELKPDVPETLANICDRSVALQPSDRYDTALALADDIDRYLDAAGLKPNSKTLAELVGPTFEAERSKMRKLVDQQIQLAQKRGGVPLGETTGGLPRLGPNHTRTASGVRPPDVDLTESGFLDLGSESIPTIETLQSVPTPANTPRPMGDSSRGLPKVAVGAILFAAIVVAAVLANQPDEEASAKQATPPNSQQEQVTNTTTPPTTGSTPSNTENAREPTLAKVETVHVKVDVWPSNARVALDGSILPRVPFDAEVTKDTSLHHLEVQAEGYASHKQMIQFDRDRDIKVVLEREREPPPPPRRRNNPNTNNQPAQTTPEPAPTPVERIPIARDPDEPGTDLNNVPKKRPVTIDTSDPYQK
jgi:serine/threonine-protein kinase